MAAPSAALGAPGFGAPNEEPAGSSRFRLEPILGLGSTAGSDLGGARAENRDQDRVWTQALLGFRLAGDLRPDSRALLRPSLTLALGAEDDWRRTGPGRTRQLSGWAPGYLELALGVGGEAPLPQSAWWQSGLVPDARDGVPGAYLSAAYGEQLADPFGLWLAGPLPAVRAAVRGSPLGVRSELGLFAAGVREVGAWDWAPAFRDRVAGAWWSVAFGREALTFMASSVHEPGQAVLPPGIWRDGPRLELWSGRAAEPEVDLKAYGLWIASRRWLRVAGAVMLERGHEIAIDPLGSQNPFTRRRLRAGLGILRLERHFRRAGEGVAQATDCSMQRPAALLCGVLHSGPGPMLGLGALVTTRDRDDDDGTLRGFAAPAARPVSFGGPFSILQSGPPVSGETPPFSNPPSRTALVDAGPRDPDGRGSVPDRELQLQNGGLRLASLYGALPLSRVADFDLQLDAFLNYGDFLTGEGYEGILVLVARGPQRGRLFLAASVARYRTTRAVSNPWTGIPEPPQTEFYRRYFVGMQWLLGPHL